MVGQICSTIFLYQLQRKTQRITPGFFYLGIRQTTPNWKVNKVVTRNYSATAIVFSKSWLNLIEKDNPPFTSFGKGISASFPTAYK